jgi:hypothetical protein
VIDLNDAEVVFLEKGGSDLELITNGTKKLLNERKQYETFADCGYLDVDQITGRATCSVYDDPNRPKACDEFKVNSEPCNYMRRGFGLSSN